MCIHSRMKAGDWNCLARWMKSERSIRAQLSVETLQEEGAARCSKPNSRRAVLLLQFVPPHTRFVVKDYQHALTCWKSFEQVESKFHKLESGVGLSPEKTFCNTRWFFIAGKTFQLIEFGSRNTFLATRMLLSFIHPLQPVFNKILNWLPTIWLNADGRVTAILSERKQPRQLERLQNFSDSAAAAKIPTARVCRCCAKVLSITNPKLLVYTDHQILNASIATKRKSSSAKAALTFRTAKSSVGDFVTHIDFGIAVCRAWKERSRRSRKKTSALFSATTIYFISVSTSASQNLEILRQSKAPARDEC